MPYTPVVELKTEIAEKLLANRSLFLSQLVYQTYNGYVLSQFRKLEQDLRTTGTLKWKHAMHLIRLLLSGITILKEQELPVAVVEHRERLLAIKAGTVAWAQVNEWRLELHKQFDQARDNTTLPERPNYEWVNDFLVESRRKMVDK